LHETCSPIRVLIVFLSLAATRVGASEITVTQFSCDDPPGLLEALADASYDTITLDPNDGSFALTQNLVIKRNVDLEIHASQNDVVFDCNDLYLVQLHNPYEECTINVNMNSAGKRIIFTRGYNPNGSTQGGTQIHCIREYPFTVNMKNCDFTNATIGSGLMLGYPSHGPCHINLTNCRAYNNPRDNIAMRSSGNDDIETMFLTLNNCEVFESDNNQTGSPSGDGVTAHMPSQVCYINGGSLHDNPKAAVAFVGGSRIYINGTEFFDNGAPFGLGDIVADSGALVHAENCTFTNLDDTYSSGSGPCHVWASGQTYIIIDKCTFKNPAPGKDGCPIWLSGGTILVRNSIFDSFVNAGSSSTRSGCIMVEGSGKIWIENNVFYNCLEGVRIDNLGAHLSNNIFHTVDTAIAGSQTSSYYKLESNGHNCFYQCQHLFADDDTYLQATDLVDIDPLFYDPINHDFRLLPLSPCLNAGTGTLLGGFTDIGVWQGESIVRDLPPNCALPLRLDANHDCKINLADLALLADYWLACNLVPPGICD
jgi:hypothetical protein